MNSNTESKLTSLSMHSTLVEQLMALSDETGFSSDEIIVYCLARYAKEVEITLNLKRLVKYQQRCRQYKPFLVTLPQALYEKGFDLRKSLKLSLSFIFALAFAAYLKDLKKIPKIQNTSFLINSNNDELYKGTHFVENERHLFIYSWEKPPE